MDDDLLHLLRGFALALFIGALIGVDREKRLERERIGPGGLRTFILFAEAGAIAAWLSAPTSPTGGLPWLFLAGLLALSVLLASGHVADLVAGSERSGMTTEAAALVTYLLGGAAILGPAEVAVALAIVTSGLLALKQPLHDAVARIHRDDLTAGLKLLFASFIVLPLLPNHPVDPWEVLNPWKLWALVVLISALSLAGYVAVRWLGPKRGIAVTGLAGGLVSSTALTVAFARRSKDDSEAERALFVGMLLAWTVMFGRVLVEITVVNPSLLVLAGSPVAMMGVTGALIALRGYLHAGRRASGESARAQEAAGSLRNPFSLLPAMRFAVLFALVLLLVEAARRFLPESALYVVAALAGIADVDAITLSLASAAGRDVPGATAARGIVLASVVNTGVKLGITFALGRPSLGRRLAGAAVAIAAAGAATLIVSGLLR